MLLAEEVALACRLVVGCRAWLSVAGCWSGRGVVMLLAEGCL